MDSNRMDRWLLSAIPIMQHRVNGVGRQDTAHVHEIFHRNVGLSSEINQIIFAYLSTNKIFEKQTISTALHRRPNWWVALECRRTTQHTTARVISTACTGTMWTLMASPTIYVDLERQIAAAGPIWQAPVVVRSKKFVKFIITINCYIQYKYIHILRIQYIPRTRIYCTSVYIYIYIYIIKVSTWAARH